jgi:transposase
MGYYAGFDLHSNNTVIGIIDEQGKRVYKRKVENFIQLVWAELEPFKDEMIGVVVESTFNWYWLVDGMMEAGYKLHLANPSAIKQYEGLKHTDDYHDAFHLANLLRLGILPEGYIYPKEQRATRDLLRKRLMLVRHRTAHILSFQSLYYRHTGCKINSVEIKRLREEEVERFFDDPHVALASKSHIAVIGFLSSKIKEIERASLKVMKPLAEFKKITTVYGIGEILALTIMLETGPISRFPKVGNYASYCRCVASGRYSNEKKKGQNNRKNGNAYLSWAYMEAANFAKRYYPAAQAFYQRKLAKTNKIVAIKALAHKLARASYFVIKDEVDFNPEKLFG